MIESALILTEGAAYSVEYLCVSRRAPKLIIKRQTVRMNDANALALDIAICLDRYACKESRTLGLIKK